MATRLEDLRVLRVAEEIADGLWQVVAGWDIFERDVVGKQLARAADSVGANIAESYGRFHYGEKLQFLYYARGSLFESKYWVNRAKKRGLLEPSIAQKYAEQLDVLARQLNGFANSLKKHRSSGKKGGSSSVREASPVYSWQESVEIDEL